MPNITIGNVTAGRSPLIAVPLTDKDVLSGISVDDADIIEMRVDMFENVSDKYVADVLKKAQEEIQKPIITTIRAFEEGGAIQISDKERKNLYKAVINLTDAVDIEIQSEIYGSIVKLARKKKRISVGSFHDFTKTPSAATLLDIIKKGKSFKADIVKVAVMPNSLEDLRTITDITLRFHDIGLITVAMGEIGMASRIFFPLIGSLLTFAYLDTTTAPGQLSLSKMKEFFSVFQDE